MVPGDIKVELASVRTAFNIQHTPPKIEMFGTNGKTSVGVSITDDPRTNSIGGEIKFHENSIVSGIPATNDISAKISDGKIVVDEKVSAGIKIDKNIKITLGEVGGQITLPDGTVKVKVKIQPEVKLELNKNINISVGSEEALLQAEHQTTIRQLLKDKIREMNLQIFLPSASGGASMSPSFGIRFHE